MSLEELFRLTSLILRIVSVPVPKKRPAPLLTSTTHLTLAGITQAFVKELFLKGVVLISNLLHVVCMLILFLLYYFLYQ